MHWTPRRLKTRWCFTPRAVSPQLSSAATSMRHPHLKQLHQILHLLLLNRSRMRNPTPRLSLLLLLLRLLLHLHQRQQQRSSPRWCKVLLLLRHAQHAPGVPDSPFDCPRFFMFFFLSFSLPFFSSFLHAFFFATIIILPNKSLSACLLMVISSSLPTHIPFSID